MATGWAASAILSPSAELPFGHGGNRLMSPPAPGPWRLPVEGWDVLTVIFAFQIDIIAYGDGGPTCTIRLAGTFQFSEPDGQVHNLDAEQQSWGDLTPVLNLRHDKIASATATAAAHLLVTFASGRTLGAEADGRPYEHWQIDAPGIKLIALPGDGSDGVAVWTRQRGARNRRPE
jgi:hypothetical protein